MTHIASEKARVDGIVAYLHSLPAWVYKTHGSSVGRSGIPDLLVCYLGHFFAFEVKNDTGRPSNDQKRNIRVINKRGGTACVVRSRREVQTIIEAYEVEVGYRKATDAQ